METPVFQSDPYVIDTTAQNYQIWVCNNDVYISDMYLIVNGTDDNLSKGPVKIQIGSGPLLDEWSPEIEISLVPNKFISLAALSAGYSRTKFAGDDEIYLKIVSPLDSGTATITVVGVGFSV